MSTPKLKHSSSTIKGILSWTVALQLILAPVTVSMPNYAWAEETAEQKAQREQEEARKQREAEELARREAQVQDMNNNLNNQTAEALGNTEIADPGTEKLESDNFVPEGKDQVTVLRDDLNSGDSKGKSENNKLFFAGKTVYDPRRHESFDKYALHMMAMCSAVWGTLATMACPMTPSMLIFGLASAVYLGMEISLAASYQKGAALMAVVDEDGALDQQASNLYAAYKLTKRGEEYARTKAEIIYAVTALTGVAFVMALMEIVICEAAAATVVGRALIQRMCRCHANVAKDELPGANPNLDPMKALFPKTFFAINNKINSFDIDQEQYIYAHHYEYMLNQENSNAISYVLIQEWQGLKDSNQSVDIESYRSIANSMNKDQHFSQGNNIAMGKIFAQVIKNAWQNFKLFPEVQAADTTTAKDDEIYCLNPNCTTKCLGESCIEAYGVQAIFECLDADCKDSCKGLGCRGDKPIASSTNSSTLPSSSDLLSKDGTLSPETVANQTATANSTGSTGAAGADENARAPASDTSSSPATTPEATLNEQEIQARNSLERDNLKNSANAQIKFIKDSNLSQEKKDTKIAVINSKLDQDLKRIDDNEKSELAVANGEKTAGASDNANPTNEKALRDKFDKDKMKIIKSYNTQIMAINNNKEIAPDEKQRQIAKLKREEHKKLAQLKRKFKGDITDLRKSGRLPLPTVSGGTRGGTFIQKYLLYPLGIHTPKDVGFAAAFGYAIFLEFNNMAGYPESRAVLMLDLMVRFILVSVIANQQADTFGKNAKSYKVAMAHLAGVTANQEAQSNSFVRDGEEDQSLSTNVRGRRDYFRTFKDEEFASNYPCLQGPGRTLDQSCDCKKTNTCTKVVAPKPSTFKDLNIPKDVGFASAVADGSKLANSINSGDIQQARTIAGDIAKNNALSNIRKIGDKKLSEINKSRTLAGKKAFDPVGESQIFGQKLAALTQQAGGSDAFKGLFGNNALTPPSSDVAGSHGKGGKNGEDDSAKDSAKKDDDKKDLYVTGTGGSNNASLKKLDSDDEDIELGALDAPGAINDTEGPLGDPNDPNNPKNAYNPKSPYFKGIYGIIENPEEDLFGVISKRYTKSALPSFLRKRSHASELGDELPE